MTAPDHLIDRDGDVWVELHPDRFFPALIGESCVIPDEVAVRHPGLAVPLDTLLRWIDDQPNPDPAVTLAALARLQAEADEREAALLAREA